ncbi:hypothetical protein HBA54_24100 [Pelagibius litoralis]|uniref:Uncharacterized protein n=1 Tax=Pelagibius litoralis TaxID=374515 RepID=A0A967F2F6_9PROT|nr:hypothetical protein [Pelagibius litoralis]NIA71680.1 hypothetical protein [Pelagibius litoralis]
MTDIQFWRGHANEQSAAAGRFGRSSPASSADKPEAGTPAADMPGAGKPGETAEAEFTFDDFLDIINPLQHIPVVSSLYRELTGDEISAPARVIGGTLFGGPSGFVSAIANTLFDEVAGEDVGASVLAWFSGEDDSSEGQVASDGAVPGGGADPFAAAPLVTAAGSVMPAVAPATMPKGDGDPTGFIPTAMPLAPQPQLPPLPQAQPGKPETPAAGRQETSGNGLLTGQAALNALFNDLHGGAAVTPPASQPPSMPPSIPLDRSAVGQRTRAVTADSAGPPDTTPQNPAAATNPLLSAAGAPDAALAERMLKALDKYGAMTQQRQQQNQENPPVDTRDPALPRL